MKAVVLSGGQGTRLRPLTYSTPKQLVPVGGIPVLGHVINDILACGISDVAIVTSPDAEQAMATFSEGYAARIQVLVQPEPLGLANAFSMALPWLDGEACLLYLGDCVVTGGVSHMLDEHAESGAAASILVAEVDDPSRYGIVTVGVGGEVQALIEKPQDPPSNLAIVGAYVFAEGFGSVALDVEPSWRGEFEITDALQLLVDRGELVMHSGLRGWWIDTGTIADMLDANRRLLSVLDEKIEGSLDETSVSGTVMVSEKASVRGSTLHGPVVISPEAVVEKSEIGPNVTLGPGVRVSHSVLTDSIVMEGTAVESSRLDRSLIGPRSVVSTGDQEELSVVVSADSRIGSGRASQSG